MAKEINFIRPQEVYDRNTGESKVRYRSYDGNDRFIPVVEGENGVPKTLVEVTHDELKAMRDGGKLTAGALYRITDYNCTTTQENTQSAGHQFDIVLLALSEDKLAEEGWAMMNESNVYDVTFSDGVTKKCYAYFYTSDGDNYANVVDCVTMLGTGTSYEEGDIEINEQNKTMTYPNESSALIAENLTYNYFQNSNLSAWKVWYCLDNDTARFGWADDSLDEDSPASIMTEGADNIFVRDHTKDQEEEGTIYYGWYDSDNGSSTWTTSQEPNVGDTTYYNKGGFSEDSTVSSYTPAHEGASKKESIKAYISAEDITPIGEYTLLAAKYQAGVPESVELGGKTYYIWGTANGVVSCLTLSKTPKENDKLYYPNSPSSVVEIGYVISYQPENLVYNGRGVIYRLIDEWNNDVAYDFKNVQFVRPMTDGEYDPDGEDTWVYTMFWYNYDNSTVEDASIPSLYNQPLILNKIDTTSDIIHGTAATILPNNVITRGTNVKCSGSVNNTLVCDNSNVIQCMNIVANNAYSIYLMCNDATFDLDDPAIYINNKKVLTEE